MAKLKEAFDYPDRPGYLWIWGTPFMVNRKGRHPFIVTCDECKATVALLCGEDVAYLPALMGEPQEPPPGYLERWGNVGDPWLQEVS